MTTEILKSADIKPYRDGEIKAEKGICPLFKIPLDKSSVSRACLDHDHSIPRKGCDNTKCGRVRGVLCTTANLYLGRIEKSWKKYSERHTPITLSQFLRNAADYLERDIANNPLHHIEFVNWEKRVVRWKIAKIRESLDREGVDYPPKATKKVLARLYVREVILKQYGG